MADLDQKKKEKDRLDETINTGLAGSADDVVNRYGSGVKEHIVGYTGIDNENGTINSRSLKDIAGYKRGDPKTNPNYDTNTKQQAGFAAETKIVARRRAEEAISGRKPSTTRTDDIVGPDGKKHHVNDQLFDITKKVDAKGDPIPGESAQIKFVGSSPKEAVDKMLTKDYKKYIDNDVKIEVPSDYYDEMKSDIEERITALDKQIESVKEQGKTDVVIEKQKQLDNLKKLEKNLEKSDVSNSEAIEARNAPKWSTAKDMAKVANRAGLEQAKMGAAIGGGMSLIRNIVAVCKNEKDAPEAALAIAGDTASAAAVSYCTAALGATIKGVAQNAPSDSIKAVSTTNLPAYIAVSTLEAGKTLKLYFSGDIDGVQCLEQLGEKGYGMVNSALYAALGQMAIPIPVVGALAGSMIGYALSSVSYDILTSSLKEAKIAKERRGKIEAECEESIRMMNEYKAEIERYTTTIKEKNDFFNSIFTQIERAIYADDVDLYIKETNKITQCLGGDVLFNNQDEFDKLMSSTKTIIL
jgi:hypothetical protein